MTSTLPYRMRAPCRYCGCENGTLTPKGGQNCVYCDDCGRLAYNAPKTETGETTASLRTRPDIKPSKRARILERDNYTCVGCHRADLPLEVGHLLSVEEGRALGATDEELWSDDNLAAMCAPCNSGLSFRTVSLRLVLLVLRARMMQERNAG